MTDVKARNIVKRQISNQPKDICKTLRVSGLKSDVSKNYIRRHFVGCVKVTMTRDKKQPHLKYAIVCRKS